MHVLGSHDWAQVDSVWHYSQPACTVKLLGQKTAPKDLAADSGLKVAADSSCPTLDGAVWQYRPAHVTALVRDQKSHMYRLRHVTCGQGPAVGMVKFGAADLGARLDRELTFWEKFANFAFGVHTMDWL